jgi:hypothetical protein
MTVVFQACSFQTLLKAVISAPIRSPSLGILSQRCSMQLSKASGLVAVAPLPVIKENDNMDVHRCQVMLLINVK